MCSFTIAKTLETSCSEHLFLCISYTSSRFRWHWRKKNQNTELPFQDEHDIYTMSISQTNNKKNFQRFKPSQSYLSFLFSSIVFPKSKQLSSINCNDFNRICMTALNNNKKQANIQSSQAVALLNKHRSKS